MDRSNGFLKRITTDFGDSKTPTKNPLPALLDAPRTPGNVKAAFDSLRPATASSGIGGIIEDDKFSMN